MANFTINGIFVFIFGTFAWNSLPRGWRFLKLGWSSLRNHTEQVDAEFNVERQREMSIGSNFFLAGIAWLIGGIVSAILTIMFTVFAIFNIGVL